MPMMTNYTGQAGAEATFPAGWGRGCPGLRAEAGAGAEAAPLPGAPAGRGGGLGPSLFIIKRCIATL